MVKKVKTNLDSSNMSAPDCVPVVVLDNYDPELSLAELFNMYLKESCFPVVLSVTKILDQGGGPCCLHLPIFLIHTFSSSAGK